MDLTPNAQRFTGIDYVELYDKFRPKPPSEILQQAIRYEGNEHPDLVIDLGCGTGLSTVSWSSFAQEVIGIEPSEEMLSIARKKVNKLNSNVSFIQAFSSELPLADACVDILCCSQAFHWMEPATTLKEVQRVLRPGGLFMVYDCSWPPSCVSPLEQAYRTLFRNVFQISRTLKGPKAILFPKEKHLENIVNSGYFVFTKLVGYHQTLTGGAERLIGIARSQGGLETLFKLGYSEEEVGWTAFIKAVEDYGEWSSEALIFHYTAIFAIKS